MRIIRALALFLIVFVVLAALCALIGSLVVALRGSTTYADGIAWAMWIGGAVTVLLASLSGSSGRMAAESRVVVGGRFVSGSDIPQPQSPFVLIPAGLLVIGLGALIFIVGA
jgi:putative exporter of polyketide antibiotics